jgi:multimeric flavodoxin WrbA
MKLLGLACGRKMGNCEILLKEAMMGAEELGAEVEILCLLDLEISPILQPPRPAVGKQASPDSSLQEMGEPDSFLREMPGPGGLTAQPVLTDDVSFLWEKFHQCDGIIVAAPVYSLTPPGYLLSVRDRVLAPRGDMADSLARKKNEVPVDERHLKARAGGLISVGGATTPHWVSFGLPLLHTVLFSNQVMVCDQMQVLGSAHPGAVILDDKSIKRAHQLGRNLVEAMKKLDGKSWTVDMFGNTDKEASLKRPDWKGDEPGICPVCHCDLLIVKDKNPVECPVCGIAGELKIENGKITVTFSEKEQHRSRLTIEGKREHQEEVLGVAKAYMPRKELVLPKMAKYKAYKSYLTPPSKATK